jgi:hypothetical protein
MRNHKGSEVATDLRRDLINTEKWRKQIGAEG